MRNKCLLIMKIGDIQEMSKIRLIPAHYGKSAFGDIKAMGLGDVDLSVDKRLAALGRPPSLPPNGHFPFMN